MLVEHVFDRKVVISPTRDGCHRRLV